MSNKESAAAPVKEELTAKRSKVGKEAELKEFKKQVTHKYLDECRYDDDLNGWIVPLVSTACCDQEELCDAALTAMIESNSKPDGRRGAYVWWIYRSTLGKKMLLHVGWVDNDE